MAEVNENIADLKGVEVERSSVRVYNDSLYFAPIIGYTGKVQEDQLAGAQRGVASVRGGEGPAAGCRGQIRPKRRGWAGPGIEKSLELELQGEKGFARMYVDNMGRPREVIEQTDPKAGNDIYLTIDRDLQIGIYKLIEQQLAGILTAKLVNEDLDPNVRVGLLQAYDPHQGRLLPADQQQRALPAGHGGGGCRAH